MGVHRGYPQSGYLLAGAGKKPGQRRTHAERRVQLIQENQLDQRTR